MRDRLIIQKPTETQDTMGEPDVAWSEHEQVWAGLVEGGGSESEQRDGAMVGRRSLWRTRHRPGFTEKMRLLERVEATTLDGSITDSATTITVTSASGFPLEGEFRIQLENELLLVTAGWGTTSWTVTRGLDGTSGASHADDTVLHRMSVVDIERVTDPDGRRIELEIAGVARG